jgi:hypothetical protein
LVTSNIAKKKEKKKERKKERILEMRLTLESKTAA